MKKKQIITVLLLTGVIACLGSCRKYLSVEHYFDDRQSEERIFNSKDYTERWLANAYNALLNNNLEMGNTGNNITNYSDDMYFNESGGGNGDRYRRFKFGEYDYTWLQSWSQSYGGIRQASVMINSMADGGTFTANEVADYKAQARFVRAYLYWLLLRKYGPVPIMPDKGVNYDDSYDNLSYPRNTYDEVANYIADEMAVAAKDLPLKRDNRNIARPTRGAALATRAKALLFAASPLANGNAEMADFTNDKGEALISQQYNEGKWAKAAAACKDVMDLGTYKLYTAALKTRGTTDYPATIVPPYHPDYSEKNFPDGWADIDPFESYRSLFNGELYASENPEMIFTRGDNQISSEGGVMALARLQMPKTGGGYNSHGLTLKQSDAYSMNDGTPFDRQEIRNKYGADMFVQAGEVDDFKPLLVNVWKEFANREPRFYASVAFSGALWTMSSAVNNLPTVTNQQIFYYRGEFNGYINGDTWLPTGIGIMKFVNPKDNNSGNGGKIFPKVDLAIRYADILLMYAEALNELGSSYNIPSWNGGTTHAISRNIDEMKKAIGQVRIRAGVPNHDNSVYASKEELRKKIKRERQVELLGENQRYYDLRRWKDAPVDEAEQIYGFNTFMTKDQATLFYTPIRVPLLQTTFSKKMYFWPIDWDELKKNKRLTQAPGWPSFD
ncbi:RagB/SusD family nutrient uptake outer membrane protein [Niabella beijingensis]|uniref:RagB/SusD family nutrient uptake outer membrane protein n=1 Tax=Niabella beijingensis TaxID=2872700 RepID=UPI001CBE42DB|nr:RagB/SusD family nutrient uptake outer membrane protein [Niabella beijingensis]MBZ4191331.1 RagB/SusD family nutrient uptake outer membrane protein [Niabella beijingensis]